MFLERSARYQLNREMGVSGHGGAKIILLLQGIKPVASRQTLE
jgi:hypothetical protein